MFRVSEVTKPIPGPPHEWVENHSISGGFECIYCRAWVCNVGARSELAICPRTMSMHQAAREALVDGVFTFYLNGVSYYNGWRERLCGPIDFRLGECAELILACHVPGARQILLPDNGVSHQQPEEHPTERHFHMGWCIKVWSPGGILTLHRNPDFMHYDSPMWDSDYDAFYWWQREHDLRTRCEEYITVEPWSPPPAEAIALN